MPVPSLNTTCSKLLEWAEPLLTKEERINSAKVVTKFLKPHGEGELLQNALIDWDNHPSNSNWSAPAWKDLYLEARKPLVINSNVFYYLKSKLNEKNDSQAHIAAALISSVYNFISWIDQKNLSVDMQKGSPLCMSQYDNIFSSIRIPRLGTDEFKASQERTYIVVMHAQRMFKVDIINEKGEARLAHDIERELDVIMATSTKGQNIGLLTTMERDTWAQTRAGLLELSSHNQNCMAIIENASFALCLDEGNPEEITDISTQLLHGPGYDRFFDKSLQFIVFNNGKTGINFEHTSVDGSVMLRLIAHIYDTIDEVSFTQVDSPNKAENTFKSHTTEIEFDLNDDLKNTIHRTKESFKRHVADTQTRVLSFDSFGKEQIKQFKVSPDAFVQLALQLAEYKLYGQCFSAYEAVMTRTFVDGRIDVLYTISPESIAFIKNICDKNCDTQTTKRSLIQAAIKHIERANECRLGNGVYTHLLSLQYIYKTMGLDIGIDTLPEIFTDRGYLALTESVVCTSTTSEYGVELAGYGPIVENGYGIRYFIRNESICFNMTSRTALQDNLEQMHCYIQQSLLEMAELMMS